MPLQFSFADFMTVFAILGALGVIPIADTYRTHLTDHIYRYRRIQHYKSKKNTWYLLSAFILALMVGFAFYAVNRRKAPSFNKWIAYLLLRILTFLLYIFLMFPLLISWLYMDRAFLNYPYRQIRRRHIQQHVDMIFTKVLTGYLVTVVLVTMAMTTIHLFVPYMPLKWVYFAIMSLLSIYDLVWILGPAILSKRYLQLRKKPNSQK